MKKLFSNYFAIYLFVFVSFVSNPIIAQDVIRILAIGNSFSQDAAESYLDDLAKADGVRLIVGNMYIGGCSLETHWNNAAGSIAAYSYRKITEGDSVTLASQLLITAIKDEEWDIITFQQVSQSSGQLTSYFPYLNNLLQYVKAEATNPNVKFALHQTWAYASNSTHSGFVNYNNNQEQMYRAIVETVNSAAAQVNIDIIIPAGTAIQNGRSSYIGDNFCRDGYHLSYGIGRYTAACTWYEKLLNRPVVGNSFKPAGMSDVEAEIAQYAAHFAVTKPNDTTSLAYIEPPVSVELSYPVNIDFGSTATPFPWNNMSATIENSAITGLTDMEGNSTTVSIKINDSFGGINTNGPTSTSTSLNLPADATRDSFWGNAAGVFSGKSETTGGFLISGLISSRAYDFHMFASRTGTSDNRETYYTVTGKAEQTLLLNASNNTSSVASFSNVMPADDGTILIKIGAGANNNNVNKFFYINSMTIAPSAASDLKKVVDVAVSIYPNPVKNLAIIESKQAFSRIEVLDITGKKVLEENNLSSNRKEIDLTTLKEGYYIIRIQDQCFPLIKHK
ncbi:MAG: DUF4886 domain-containing protein [Paludibacter sp.]|nr:DUF4886 domain-containing protein [Paludibacter sp.]